MFFLVYWDKFGSHHPKQVCKNSDIFKGNICGGVPLLIKPLINSVSYLMSLRFALILQVAKWRGDIGSVGAWVRGWSESNFCMSGVGRVGPQNLGQVKKIGVDKILVWVKHVVFWSFIMTL